MINRLILLIFIIAAPFLIASCGARIPEGARAVDNFEPNRYLGTWYEIARLDHRFERNLDFVTATYSYNNDKSIKVQNRGFHILKNEWRTATGKAKLVSDDNIGRLKVSFFGPFYSGYNIIALDPDYQYALVIGNTNKYAWILSRSRTIPASIKEDYLSRAKSLGIADKQWIWVNHDEGNK